jgi:hypothetical protein
MNAGKKKVGQGDSRRIVLLDRNENIANVPLFTGVLAVFRLLASVSGRDRPRRKAFYFVTQFSMPNMWWFALMANNRGFGSGSVISS